MTIISQRVRSVMRSKRKVRSASAVSQVPQGKPRESLHGEDDGRNQEAGLPAGVGEGDGLSRFDLTQNRGDAGIGAGRDGAARRVAPAGEGIGGGKRRRGAGGQRRQRRAAVDRDEPAAEQRSKEAKPGGEHVGGILAEGEGRRLSL